MLRFLCGALALMFLAAACGDDSNGGTGATGGEGGAGGAPMVEPGPTCIAFCVQVIGSCMAFGFTEESCRQGCQTNLDDEYARAEACGEAVEAVFICVSELEDCQSVRDWRDQVPADSFPCRPEILVVDDLIADGICLP
jgi:hypothetical protein